MFCTFWLSIPPFQHFSYLPTLAQSVSLHLDLAFLPQQSLYPDIPRSIALSLHYWSVFLNFYPPNASFEMQAAQWCESSDSFCLDVTLAFISLMTSLCWLLFLFGLFHTSKWRKDHFGTLNIASCVGFVVGGDVGCCKRWATWSQDDMLWFMSLVVHLINLNETESVYWLSL